MHATALLAADRWRCAGLAGAGPRAAALARQHRPDIALMVTRHFFLFARGAGTGAFCRRSLMLGIEGICASGRSAGEAAVWFGVRVSWVTLPTIACPPSPTVTCCTVTFCSPPVR